MKKTFALLLVLCFLLPMAVACGNNEEESQTQAPTGDNSDVSTETTPEETQAATPNWDSVAKTSLGGKTIKLSSIEYDGTNTYVALDFDDYTTDILDDAIYSRNRLLESTLDCKIDYYKGPLVDTAHQDVRDRIKKAVDTGDGSVDLTYQILSCTGDLVYSGYLMPYNYVETIDLSNPWWDQTLLESTEIVGLNYYGMIDFSFGHYDEMSVIFYNGELLETNQLEDPYDLYKNKQWTMEKLLEMAEAASDDVNGDGERDIETDVFGLAKDYQSRMPMLFASGLRTMTWDDTDQVYKLHMGEERYLNVLEFMVKLTGEAVNNSGYAIYNKREESLSAFQQGRVLFYSTYLSNFKNLRSVDDNYGLIPAPAYDYESSEQYVYIGRPYNFALPINVSDDNGDGVQDYAELGIFLEAAGAYTYDVILDVYIEKTVKAKGLRDQKSEEIFDEMILHRSTDMTNGYTSFGFSDVVNLQTDRDEGFASAISSFQKRFDAFAKRLSGAILEQKAKLDEIMG